MKKANIALIALLSMTMVLAVLPVPMQSAHASTVNLKIITPNNDFIKDEFGRAFSNYYNQTYGSTVSIEWVDVGGTDADVRYIRSSFSGNNASIGIDLFWGGGVDPYIALTKEGLFEQYQVEAPANLSKIPTTIGGIPMYDSTYHWYGTALSGFGIIYNKVLLSQLNLPVPSTWEDLANPKVKGWVSSAGFESGSTHMMYELILQGYGWDKGLKIATLIGANVKSFPASSSAVPKAVSSGDVAYGLAIDFYAWAEINTVGADKIGYVFPSQLTTINPDSMAILKGAPNLDVAKRFESWILTEQAQRLWMQKVGTTGGPTKNALGRMCMIPSLYTTISTADNIVPVNPFTTTGQLAYNATKGSLRYSFLNDLLTSTLIDTHESLVTAWGQIINTNQSLTSSGLSSPKIGQAVDKLTQSPLTEAAALTLANSWSNATLRNQYITQWHTFALQRYSDAGTLTISATIETVGNLKTQGQNNLYYGLGGGTIIGLILGVVAMMFLARRREIAAVKK